MIRLLMKFSNNDWLYPYQVHLLPSILEWFEAVEKSWTVRLFAQSLKALDPHIIENAAQFLTENGHSCGNVDLIIDYL